jgi:hypothetical protein
MRNRLVGPGALVFGLVIAAGACSSSGTSAPNGSGGSGGGGTAKVTTLAGTKVFKDLTDAEVTQLCNDTLAYFGSSIPSADRCKWAGLQASSSSSPVSDAMMQMICTTHQNRCSAPDAGTGNSSICFSSIDSSCTATIAQYAACIADETAGFSAIVKTFPACSAVKVDDIPSIMATEGQPPPASCTAFTNACNALDVPNPLTL